MASFRSGCLDSVSLKCWVSAQMATSNKSSRQYSTSTFSWQRYWPRSSCSTRSLQFWETHSPEWLKSHKCMPSSREPKSTSISCTISSNKALTSLQVMHSCMCWGGQRTTMKRMTIGTVPWETSSATSTAFRKSNAPSRTELPQTWSRCVRKWKPTAFTWKRRLTECRQSYSSHWMTTETLSQLLN